MSGDLEHQFLKFNVSDAEDCGITLPAETTREAEEECSKSVVIKVLSDKAVKFPGLQNVLRIIWDFTNAFKIKSLGSNKYHIFFNCMEDLDRVLVGCPWFFENFLIVVKQWRRGIADDARAFQWGPVWIQLWDLPPEWSTIAAAEYVCKSFGRVISVRNPSMDSMQKSYIRCLVEIDLSKPILIGAFVQQDGRKIWSNFKYENLAYFCFYCGVIGHAAKTCYTKFLDLQHGIDKEDQYGLWLKALNLKEKAPKERIVIEDPSPEQPPSPGQGNAEIRKMTNYSHGQSSRDTMHVEKAYEISIPEIFLRLFQRSNLNWRPHLETLSDLTIAHGAPLVLDWTGNGGINPNPLENPRISEVDISIEAGATSVGGQNSNVFGGLGEVNDTNTTQAEEIRTEGHVIKAAIASQIQDTVADNSDLIGGSVVTSTPNVRIPMDSDEAARNFLSKRKLSSMCCFASDASVEPDLKKLCIHDWVEAASPKWLPPPTMRVLVWNCQALGGPLTISQLEEVCRLHSPDLIFLMETKNKSDLIRWVCRRLKFHDFCTVDPIGLSGVLALLWQSEETVGPFFLAGCFFGTLLCSWQGILMIYSMWMRNLGVPKGLKAQSEISEILFPRTLYGILATRVIFGLGEDLERAKSLPLKGISPDLDKHFGGLERRISQSMNQNLIRPVTENEVKKAVFGMKTHSAPGPDE